MANTTKGEPTVRSRRSLHHEKNAEADKQVQQNCYECGNQLDYHNPRKDESLGESKKKSAKSDEHQNEEGNGICENCVNSHINQQQFNEVKWKPILVFLLVILLVVATVIMGSFAWNYFKNTDKRFDVNMFNQTKEEIECDNELYDLEDTYTYQNERVWSAFAGGVKSVIAEKDNKPSVFLLLFDNDGAKKTAQCLAQDVVRVASKYLMNQKTKPLLYTGADLNKVFYLEDPGRLLVEFKQPLQESGALIVTNLQDVNPTIASSFHFFCDRYSPLVEKAIYFFTLKVENFSKNSDKKLQEIAEDELNKLWSKHLPENKLHPLITRLTGHVLKIEDEGRGCS